ncbi:formate/nitrite family transporter [Salinibius halmophilus]|uniref:formate/nitrite family transporter n=1 Tax=Salinibius halmophilus TaxID=1853216 RepID=UPI000E66D7B5|nr:formate/nitrite family transporter [Salinibius halmophilus]
MNNVHPLPSLSLTQQVINYGRKKSEQATITTFRLAACAGVFIGLAYLFYVTVTTGAGSMPWGVSHLLGGLAFSTGLILVVLCGAELFTSSILMMAAYAQGKVRLPVMLKTWLITLLGNLLGAALLVAFVRMANLAALSHGEWGLQVLAIAHHKLSHTWQEAFALGVLCNLMVCLAIWMSFASKYAGTKAALLILPVALFVSSGFEHSIANLFIVPLAWVIDPASVQPSTFITHNLIPVLIGNIVGGTLILALCQPNKSIQLTRQEAPMDTLQKHYLTHQTAGDMMRTHQVFIEADTPLNQCMARMVNKSIPAMLVIDRHQHLIGCISQEDILRFYWSGELDEQSWTALDMARQCPSITVDDPLLTTIEALTVNQSTLYPVNDGGFLTGAYLPFSERLKQACTAHCAVAVTQQGNLVGMITANEIIRQFRSQAKLTELAS